MQNGLRGGNVISSRDETVLDEWTRQDHAIPCSWRGWYKVWRNERRERAKLENGWRPHKPQEEGICYNLANTSAHNGHFLLSLRKTRVENHLLFRHLSTSHKDLKGKLIFSFGKNLREFFTNFTWWWRKWKLKVFTYINPKIYWCSLLLDCNY